MKSIKKLLTFSILFTIVLSFSSCGYNEMVRKREAVDSQWAQVENSYQRRSDLIPNLVNTVKGAANFEKETLESVISARSKATSININADQLTEENMKQFEQTQNNLSGALSRLLVTVERYPELKANANFLELQAQLEGTENRISIERKRFNDAVQEYNSIIQVFPANIYSGWFGFKPKFYFKAKEGSENAPEVQF